MSDKRITANGPAQAVVFAGGRKYNSASFTIPEDAVDLALGVDVTPDSGRVFYPIERAYFLEVAFDGDITLRMNTLLDDPIELDAGESPWRNEHIECEALYVTNRAGRDVVVKVLMM